jgi:hypothetical protein
VDDEFELPEVSEESELSEKSEESELSEKSEESEPSLSEEVPAQAAMMPYPEPAISDYHDKHSHHRRHVRQMMIPVIVCVLCFIVGFLLGWSMPTILRALGADSSVYVHSNSDDYGEVTSEETLSEPEPESASEPEPEPAPVAEKPAAVAAPVAVTTTDTISATRYLTTMARKHYGQMEYWVYIYMENADKLGHPDRLEAGTVVVIPPASKYGLIPGDKAKLSEASSLAIDIYSRFK